jgi:hypothetical protein
MSTETDQSRRRTVIVCFSASALLRAEDRGFEPLRVFSRNTISKFVISVQSRSGTGCVRSRSGRRPLADRVARGRTETRTETDRARHCQLGKTGRRHGHGRLRAPGAARGCPHEAPPRRVLGHARCTGSTGPPVGAGRTSLEAMLSRSRCSLLAVLLILTCAALTVAARSRPWSAVASGTRECFPSASRPPLHLVPALAWWRRSEPSRLDVSCSRAKAFAP